VAMLTAMVPLLVVFYEWPALYKYYTINAIRLPQINIIVYWVGGFALFAFLTNLTREIIKDIEDFEGDTAYGRNTVPVVIGVLSSKIVSICLITLTIIMLYLVWHFFVNDTITLIYVTVMIVLPLLFVIFKLIKSSEKKQLHSASRIMKIVMLTGVLYSVVVKVLIAAKVLLTWTLF
jgi:4-hydroxybenzoate polyprenyltransferase